MTPPSRSSSGSIGPPDRQTLRLLERVFADDTLVSETVFDPDAHEPHSLSVSLETDRYPPSVDAARIDVRWFTSGDFSFHYLETTVDGDRWECRWDCHPNGHNARLHVHLPPDCTDIEDLSLPSRHPLEVRSTVLAAIDHRLRKLWETGR